MKASELIKNLVDIISLNGDCEVLHWDSAQMKHIPINDVKYVTNIYYSEKLANECPEYAENFNTIKNNIIFD